MVEKVIRDDNVAVLISPGFGAGWTTWNNNHPLVEQMLYDSDIVNRILEWEKNDGNNWNQCVMRLKEIADAKYNQDPDDYFFGNGLEDVEVVWVKKGRKFIINEYDGSESIQFLDATNWITP